MHTGWWSSTRGASSRAGRTRRSYGKTDCTGDWWRSSSSPRRLRPHGPLPRSPKRRIPARAGRRHDELWQAHAGAGSTSHRPACPGARPHVLRHGQRLRRRGVGAGPGARPGQEAPGGADRHQDGNRQDERPGGARPGAHRRGHRREPAPAGDRPRRAVLLPQAGLLPSAGAIAAGG